MSAGKLKDTLVIIPAYNEVENIGLMLKTLTELYPMLSVLIVNDGSVDGTGEVVKNYSKDHANVFLIDKKKNEGLAKAYLNGFEWAKKSDFKYFLQMDCDFQHDPKEISTLLDKATEENLVIGSRYINGMRVRNWPLHRVALSYFAGVYTRFLTGLRIKDVTGGFKCFGRKTFESLDLSKVFSQGFCFQIELNYKTHLKGYKIIEVPITFHSRLKGKSKMSLKIILEAFVNVLKLRFIKI
jgi:dolichol-phosphate mannosyltransferase